MSRLNVFTNMKDRISSTFTRPSSAKSEMAFRASMADDEQRISMPRASGSEKMAGDSVTGPGALRARTQLSRVSSSGGSMDGSFDGEVEVHKAEVAASRRMSTTYSRDIDPDFGGDAIDSTVTPPASTPARTTLGDGGGQDREMETEASIRIAMTYSRDIDPDFRGATEATATPPGPPPGPAPRFPAEVETDVPLPPAPNGPPLSPRSALKKAGSPRTRTKKGISFEEEPLPPDWNGGHGGGGGNAWLAADSTDFSGRPPSPLNQRASRGSGAVRTTPATSSDMVMGKESRIAQGVSTERRPPSPVPGGREDVLLGDDGIGAPGNTSSGNKRDSSMLPVAPRPVPKRKTGRGTIAKHRKSMVPPDYEGWLITRKENQALGWKKRYVRLRGPTFTVYRDECIAAAKAQYDLTDWRFYPSRGKGNKFSTRKEIFRFTLESPKGEMYDWAADIEELRTKWLEMLGYAAENGRFDKADSTKMLTQFGETPTAVQVSCSFFQEHGTFGFSKCGVCGFSKRQHFSPAEVGPATSGLKYSGFVLVKKRKDRAAKNWKKRFMELKDNSLTWKTDKQQADSDYRVVITMECELLRLNKQDKAEDEDGVGGISLLRAKGGTPSNRMMSLERTQNTPPSFRGSGFIFTIKSASGETHTFQVQTSDERERWLEALLAARMFVYEAHTTRVKHAQAALTSPDTPAAQIEQETLYLKALQEMTPPRPIIADATEHNEADKLSKLARQLREDDAKLNGFLQDTGRKNGVMKLARTLQRLNNAAMLTSRDMQTCVSILACFQAIIRTENGRNMFLRQFEVVEEVCNLATCQTEPNRNAHQLQPQAAIMASSMILSPLVLVSTLGCEIITEYIRSMATPGFEDYDGAPEPRPFESIVGIMNNLRQHSQFDVLAALTGLVNAITQAPRTPEERSRYRAELRRVGFEQFLLTVLELDDASDEPVRGSLLGVDADRRRESRTLLVNQATAYQLADRHDLDELEDTFDPKDFECVLHKLWRTICHTDEPALRGDATSEMMAILRGVEDGEVQQSSKKWEKGPAVMQVEQEEFERMENEIIALRQELEDAKVPTLDAEAVERAAKLEEENKRLNERIAQLEAGVVAAAPAAAQAGAAASAAASAEAKPVNPLTAMLAARTKGGVPDATSESKPVNPLAAMLAARVGGSPAPAEATAEAKPANPLAAMLAARTGTGGGVASLPGRKPPAGDVGESPTLKYEKMLKMHIPKEAVKMKMQAEGVDPSLLFKEDVVGGDGTPAPPPGVDMTKYIKMLKMHIPRSAVILKMQSEGIDPIYLPGGGGDAAMPRAAVVKYTGPRPKGKVRALFWEKVGAAGSWWSGYKGGFTIISKHMDALEGERDKEKRYRA